MKIEKLYTYPVKALRAVELDSVEVTKHGFPHDRRFMLLQVHRGEVTKYENIHIAEYPQSILFHPSLDLTNNLLTIHHKPPNTEQENNSITFPLAPNTTNLDLIDIEMHKSPTKAYRMPQQYNDWLTACYGFEVILCYLGGNYRRVLMSTSNDEKNQTGSWLSTYLPKPTITFADCAPYLVASSTSLLDLHPRLNDPSQPTTNQIKMDILKFRPNILISGAPHPWSEDFWSQLTLPRSQAKIACVHNCGRCKSINIDYATGKQATGPEGQMLKRMQRDRRVDPGTKYSPIFGRYAFLEEGEGRCISVGEEVEVSKVRAERSVFDWEGLSTA